MADSQTLGILTQLGFGGAVLLIVLIVYDFLRLLHPSHCYSREQASQQRSHNRYDGTPLPALPRPSRIPLAWLVPTLTYPEHSIIKSHGLDVAMFLRFLSTQAILFGSLSIFTAIFLFPTYITAENRYREESASFRPPVGIEIASLSNVPDHSYRLWITLVADFFVLALACYLLYHDIHVFTHHRRSYRASSSHPSNFALLITDVTPPSPIPNTDTDIDNHTNPDIIPDDTSNDISSENSQDSHLSPTYNTLRQVLDKLLPTQIVAIIPVRDAEALLALKSRAVAAIRRREHAHHLAHLASPPGGKTATAIPSDPVLTPSTSVMNTDKSPTNATRKSSSSRPYSSDVGTSGNSKRQSHSSSHRRTMTREEIERITEQLVSAQKLEKELRQEVMEAEQDLDKIAPFTSFVIVVVRSKRVATGLATAPFWPDTDQAVVSRAPEPRALNWNRLDINKRTTRVRQVCSLAIITALAIFWTIPSGLIQGLGNFKEIAKKWPDSPFDKLLRNNPGFTKFLEGVLPPLLLFLTLLLVPIVVRYVISFERIASKVNLEAKLRNYLFFFYVMSNFVYVVLFGSFLKLIGSLFDEGTNIFELLSTSVPGQATFLMEYVMINAFLGSTLGMLNIGRLLLRPIIRARARTEVEKQATEGLFTDYPFAKVYAICMMISLISFVYSTIAPVINVVAFIYFALGYICNKQLLLYSHRPMFEGGGYLFRDCFTGSLMGLFLHQLSMIGIFSLKRAAAQGVIMTCSVPFTIWFGIFCRNKFLSRLKHGSLVDQFNNDEDSGLADEIPAEYVDMYVHPGLKPLEALQEQDMDPCLAQVPEVSKEQLHLHQQLHTVCQV